MIQFSEYVSLGHPDKIADYISSYLLDRYIERDPATRYAVEVQIKNWRVTLGGEVSSKCNFTPDEITAHVRAAVNEIGYTRAYLGIWGHENAICGDLLAVESLITQQSPDIARGLNGWGDQGIFFGHAAYLPQTCYMPLDYTLARRLNKALFESGIGGLDIKTQVVLRDQAVEKIIVAIPLLDDHKARIIEKGVPSPLERLDAIQRIAEADAGGATLRLRPFIIGISTPTYLDLIREAATRGATAMSTEFMCVEQRSLTLREWMPTFNELCGFDFMEFYRKYSVSSGYLRLNRHVKEPFMRNMKSLCDELGMRFYVSDAHFKELCCNGSCCGLPTDWNYSRGQFCEALQLAKKAPDGLVRWDDIKGDIETLVGDFQWHSASGYNCNSSTKRAKFFGMTMAEYMRWLWNNPQAGQSPYKLFEGALVPTGKDADGNIIYKYNGAKF